MYFVWKIQQLYGVWSMKENAKTEQVYFKFKLKRSISRVMLTLTDI